MSYKVISIDKGRIISIWHVVAESPDEAISQIKKLYPSATLTIGN